jgi:hypothetical protein
VEFGDATEFNRISMKVLVVVTMKILTIFLDNVFIASSVSASLLRGTRDIYGGGRTELLANLKALMRSVAMMNSDLEIIAEMVMLQAEGFREARPPCKEDNYFIQSRDNQSVTLAVPIRHSSDADFKFLPNQNLWTSSGFACTMKDTHDHEEWGEFTQDSQIGAWFKILHLRR